MVVIGNAIIMPMIPKIYPHTERANSIKKGGNPIALPMMRGVRTVSCMICTKRNTQRAQTKTSQKFCPVSAALIKESRTTGINPRA